MLWVWVGNHDVYVGWLDDMIPQLQGWATRGSGGL
jgi:hypothetical protein